MKKKIITCLLVASMSMASFVACGQSENTVAGNSATESESAAAVEEAKGYSFEVNGVALTPDMDIDTVLDKLGEPVSTFESESCAKQGMAYLYTFADFEIETYPDGDTNRIYYISFLNDNVTTTEGVDLSFSKDAVIEVYGEPTETTDTTLIYKSKDSDSKLKFIFESDDTMISIEYDSKEM